MTVTDGAGEDETTTGGGASAAKGGGGGGRGSELEPMLPTAVEFEPPFACVRRILKNTLPASTNVGKDASAAFARASGKDTTPTYYYYVLHCYRLGVLLLKMNEKREGTSHFTIHLTKSSCFVALRR